MHRDAYTTYRDSMPTDATSSLPSEVTRDAFARVTMRQGDTEEKPRVGSRVVQRPLKVELFAVGGQVRASEPALGDGS